MTQRHAPAAVLLITLLAGVTLLAATLPSCDGTMEPCTVPPNQMLLGFEPIPVDGAPRLVTHFKFLPNAPDEMLLLTLTGVVEHHRLEAKGTQFLGRFRLPNVHSEQDCGLISAAFDPNFAQNHIVYFAHCFDKYESGIVRVTFEPGDYEGIANSTRLVFRTGDPKATRAWHNVGHIGFFPDGTMWALFGDKSIAKHAQDLSNDLGALLRIKPRTGASEEGYEAAPGNPFATQGAPNVYALGFRSPWTGLLDSKGHLWVGDVGNQRDEVNVVTAPGQNFGWGEVEGDCKGRADCRKFKNPLRHWDRRALEFVNDNPEPRQSIKHLSFVGVEYLPSSPQQDRYAGCMTGRVIYGDMCAGFVRAAKTDAEGRLVRDRHVAHAPYVSHWNVGADGYIYAMSFGGCTNDRPREAVLLKAVLGPFVSP